MGPHLTAPRGPEPRRHMKMYHVSCLFCLSCVPLPHIHTHASFVLVLTCGSGYLYIVICMPVHLLCSFLPGPLGAVRGPRCCRTWRGARTRPGRPGGGSHAAPVMQGQGGRRGIWESERRVCGEWGREKEYACQEGGMARGGMEGNTSCDACAVITMVKAGPRSFPY